MPVTSIESETKDRTLEGIAWMVATGICFAVVTGIVRYLGLNLPAVEAAFIRYLIGVLLMGTVLLKLLKFKPSAKLLGGFVIRGLVHGIAVILWFFAMARIPMSEVTAIGFTTPIFATIGAALFFSEKLHRHRIASVLIGFIGALVILRPGFQEVSIGQLAQLSAAPLFAISFLIAKKLTEHVNADVIVAMLSVMCTLVLLPGALMVWQTPTWHEVFWLGATAFFATLGHYTVTRALQAAPISVTQPVSFLQLVWATLMGIVMFGEAIDPYVILGGGIIVISATYISHREARGARARVTPVEPQTKL